MKLTAEDYKKLSVKEFTEAEKSYEKSGAGVYAMCRKDYPAILAEAEKEPFETLLDAGCGPGPMIAILAEKFPGKRYTGIDLTPAMIDAAKAKNIPNAEFVVGDCEALPFADGSFDIILCANSAHHYPNIQRFYESAYRCLRPGGRLIICDYTTDSGFLRWLIKTFEIPLLNSLGRGDVGILLREEVAKGLERTGFEIETNEIHPGGRLHIVARKSRIV